MIAGSTQPAEVQEAVHRLNVALGNQDRTVFYTAPVLAEAESIAELVTAMQGGAVQALVMLETNPAYDAAGDLNFIGALDRVPLKIHAGPHVDETALRADWHLPSLHPLEAWGDARSLDGTVGLIQPTIAPLYDGRSAAEIVALLTDGQEHPGRDLLRAQWQGGETDDAFAPRWEAMLGAGFVPESAFPHEPVQLIAAGPPGPAAVPAGLDVLFRPDPSVWDGSVADNAWLQELPGSDHQAEMWENAITVGPAFPAREHAGQAGSARSRQGPSSRQRRGGSRGRRQDRAAGKPQASRPCRSRGGYGP